MQFKENQRVLLSCNCTRDLQWTDLFRVPVTQHEVGSFNVSMDVLILMYVLQYIHLAQESKAYKTNFIGRQ